MLDVACIVTLRDLNIDATIISPEFADVVACLSLTRLVCSNNDVPLNQTKSFTRITTLRVYGYVVCCG
jgi:hypothetical protein